MTQLNAKDEKEIIKLYNEENNLKKKELVFKVFYRWIKSKENILVILDILHEETFRQPQIFFIKPKYAE